VATLHLAELHKTFMGKPPAVPMDGLNLDIDDGEFLVVLGPSGCGKTTTLRCIAGLENPDSGSIRFGEDTVFDSQRRINRPPNKRSIGMVFQSYALWPHLTVRKNLGYPLKARKLKSTSRGWIEESAALVDCSHLLDRYPAQLSGGQQQRVALARGLVARPELMLFDEPMSNLDAQLRVQVRSELHELHRRLGFTAVFVTHDQTEALALADRMAIMHSGRFEQLGTPQDIYDNPATERVAEFIGMSNRLILVPSADGPTVNGVALEGTPLIERGSDPSTLRTRPEDLTVTPPEIQLAAGWAGLAGTVVDTQFGGRNFEVLAAIGESRVTGTVQSDAYEGWARGLEPGDRVSLSFRPNRTAIYSGADNHDVPEISSQVSEATEPLDVPAKASPT
jgi:iron(III) transport system ATP-binding protein